MNRIWVGDWLFEERGPEFDAWTPPWWNGRRIHAWHTRPRIVFYDEVGDYPEALEARHEPR